MLTFTLQGKSGSWTTSALPDKASFTLNKSGSNHEIQFTTSWGPANHSNQTIGSLAPFSVNLSLQDPTGTAIGSLSAAPGAINLSKFDASTSYLKVYLNNDADRYISGSINFASGAPDISVEQPKKKKLKDGKATISFGTAKVGKKKGGV